MEQQPDWLASPGGVAEFLYHAEIQGGGRLIGDLFARRFAAAAPDFPRHMLSLLRQADGSLLPAGYAHLTVLNTLGYVGGVLTDETVVRRMSPAQRVALRASGGGVYFHLLRYTFSRFENELDAFVGYCGDARALQVNLSAGFQPTRHRYLLIRPNGKLDATRLDSLIEEAHAQGPF